MIEMPEKVINLLNSDNCKKNYRIVGNGFEITNENISEGSVAFTESVCSKKFKFGGDEKPIFECETFDVDSIQDEKIAVYCDIIDGEDTYSIPLGIFLVDSCKRKNGDPRFRSVIAYGLDEKINLGERLQKSIEFAVRSGYEYSFHPEGLRACYTADITDGFTSVSTKTSYISLDKEIKDIPFVGNNIAGYADLVFSANGKGEATFSLPKAANNDVSPYGVYIQHMFDENFGITRIKTSNGIDERFQNIKNLGFMAFAGVDVTVQIGTIPREDYVLRVYYSKDLYQKGEVMPLEIMTRLYTATITALKPNASEGNIAYLKLKDGKKAFSMPDITRPMNTYFFIDDPVGIQMLEPQEWLEYLKEIDDIYHEWDTTGKICNECFEVIDYDSAFNVNVNGVVAGFELSVSNTEIDYLVKDKYTDKGFEYWTYTLDSYGELYNPVYIDKIQDTTDAYEFMVKPYDSMLDLRCSIPSDFKGNISEFIVNANVDIVEISGMFYKQMRDGSFKYIDILPEGLVPNTTLKPSKTLVPSSGAVSVMNTKNLQSVIYDDKDIERYNQIDYKYRDNTGEYDLTCYGWSISRSINHVLYDRLPLFTSITVDVDFSYNGDVYVKCDNCVMVLIYENDYEERISVRNVTSAYSHRLFWRDDHGKYKNVKQIRFEFAESKTWSTLTNVKIWQEEYISVEPIKPYVMESNNILDFCVDFENIKNVIEITLAKIKNVIFRPMKISMLGRPDIESGDIIEVHIDGNAYSVPLLRRTMSGEQFLVDKISIGE